MSCIACVAVPALLRNTSADLGTWVEEQGCILYSARSNVFDNNSPSLQSRATARVMAFSH